MAPEFPVFLLVFTLRMEGTSLVAELENVERAGDARIRARWSERSPMQGFRPVGGGVLHVEETPNILFLEPRQVQLDELGDWRYRWIQGTPADVPFVMIAVVFPRGYTFRAPNVPPESSKVFNGQIATYWCLRGNDLGRTLLEWTVQPLARSAEDEVRFLNARSTLGQIPGVAAIDVDTTRSPSNVGLSIFLCHSSQDKPRVRELHRRLKNDGHVPWLDEEDILPGEKWETAIADAVRLSSIVLVCLSKQSVNKEGFLQKEISEVLQVAEEKPEDTIFVIPLRLEEVSVPRRLSQWQWLDYFQQSASQADTEKPEESQQSGRPTPHERLLLSLKKRAAQLSRV